MTKYDKIWVPEKKQGMAFRDANGDTPCILGGPMVVVTIEELRQLWDHCAMCQVDKETDYANTINFNAYLQSKGITL